MKKPDLTIRNVKSVEEMLTYLPQIGTTDTAYALVQICEAAERSYRETVLAGLPSTGITHVTNSLK